MQTGPLELLRASTRLTLLLGFALFVSRPAAAANVLIFPQFVTGGGYTTITTLVNTNFSTPVTGTLAIYNQDGSPRTTAIDGLPSGATFQVTIPAGGTVVLNTTPVSGNAVVGMAKFTSDYPAGGVVRFQFAGGQVGVLNAPIQSFATLVLDTSSGNDTGVAIANPGPSPVNIRLNHVDENGRLVESIDPRELNPLPVNGQVAKFVTQFGFAQVANRAKGSIQIQTKGDGAFSAFALLLKDGALSSTAVVRGSSGKIALNDFNRSYSGTWTNSTFGSTGGATILLSIDSVTQLVVINLSLSGNVFGSSSPSPAALYGTFKLSGFTATGNSSLFGPMTMTLDPDGNWTFTANNVPGGNIASFKITGKAYPEKIAGDYVVTFVGGGSATGTVTMNNSGT